MGELCNKVDYMPTNDYIDWLACPPYVNIYQRRINIGEKRKKTELSGVKEKLKKHTK